jgi:RNA polymerase sigma-B factor
MPVLDAPPRPCPADPRTSGERLLLRWRRTGDPRCRAAAVEAYLPLARKLAKRYDRGPEPLEDLHQVAYLGLVKAVDRFDPAFGVRFGSYAIPTILGELRRHFRDATWSVHMPRPVQESLLAVRAASDRLTDRLGRAPTVGELADAPGLDLEQVTEALQARAAKDPSSLDQPVGGGDDEVSATLGEALGDVEDGFDLVDHRLAIAPALRALPRRDREILFLRFGLDLTQSEIAQRVGCSQMQVSRLLRRALERVSAVDREPAGVQ